jgi:hypothetical protein
MFWKRNKSIGIVATNLVLAAFLVGMNPSATLAAISGSLTISPTTISFADASPTTSPTIAANSTVRVSIIVSGAYTYQTWSVHGLANGNLVSGTNTIAIGNITWTETRYSGSCPSGRICTCVASGTMSSTTPVNLITGRGNTQTSPGFQCTATFSLANRWSYNPGTYSQSFVITFTAP